MAQVIVKQTEKTKFECMLSVNVNDEQLEFVERIAGKRFEGNKSMVLRELINKAMEEELAV